MTSRDRLPGGSDLLRLELSYDFKLSSKSSVAPQFPITNHLYDGPFAVLSCIYSGSKEVCAWGDMYKRDVSLSKGSYTLKMGEEFWSWVFLGHAHTAYDQVPHLQRSCIRASLSWNLSKPCL